MERKDCENAGCTSARSGGTGSLRPPLRGRASWTLVGASVVLCAHASDVRGESVRLWSSAVVVDDSIRVEDVCELRGLDSQTERRLAQLVVGEAPAAGGSRIIHLELIRSVLAASGANLARLTLSGATQCAITRPSRPSLPSASAAGRSPTASASSNRRKPEAERKAHADSPEGANGKTLRQAVIDHFNTEFARYGGTAEIIFDRTSEQVLDLSGPAYEFKVRRKGNSPLGLCPLEVEVLSQGRTVQTVPLVVQVTLTRRVVIARRTINQGAAIAAADVELTALSFTRVDELGLDDAAQAVGQRAKRVISAGSLVETEMLEAVPLVLRGQLVTMTSLAGAVRVVTTGKAGDDGRRGEVIRVRAADDRKVEFDAVVVGPGEVQLGAGPATKGESRLALGDQR
ncbi:MAG: flagellar basal body P-ring formation chaperone FlgA [Planctomycetota bacterium]